MDNNATGPATRNILCTASITDYRNGHYDLAPSANDMKRIGEFYGTLHRQDLPLDAPKCGRYTSLAG